MKKYKSASPFYIHYEVLWDRHNKIQKINLGIYFLLEILFTFSNSIECKKKKDDILWNLKIGENWLKDSTDSETNLAMLGVTVFGKNTDGGCVHGRRSRG